MEIKILGPGCAKCHQLEKMVREAVAETGMDAHIEKVSDIKEFARYGVFMTPALVMNGEVKVVGKIPRKDEILGWLRA